jgi:WD40 repeat protein
VTPLQVDDPQQVGAYQLVQRLGSGGMGQVFLGRSPGGRMVAVKVIHPERVHDSDFRARFRREVQAAQRVSGAFTAPMIGADPDAPTPWLVTAYVAGPSLQEAIAAHGPLPIASVRGLAAGLAEALASIHAAGVVHRDLKPSNVLLAADGPRVIDFGIAKAADASLITRTGFTVGTAGFMSPEQLTGGQIGPASDVFSLGAVLAFAANGVGPFGHGNSRALDYRVVHGEPDLDALPDKALQQLITSCLAKDPGQRPSLARVLAQANPDSSSERLTAAVPGADWLPTAVRTEIANREIRPADRGGPGVTGTAMTRTGAGPPGRTGVAPHTHHPRSAAPAPPLHAGSPRAVAQAPPAGPGPAFPARPGDRPADLAAPRPIARRRILAVTAAAAGVAVVGGASWAYIRALRPAGLIATLGNSIFGTFFPVAFSPDGRTLATGGRADSAGYSRAAELWDIASRQVIATLPLPQNDGWLNSLAFSPDGRTLATASSEARLWNVADRKLAATLPGSLYPENYNGLASVAFSPDGRTLAGGTYETVTMWDVASHRAAATLAGHDNLVYAVAFSPDGHTLATGSQDGTVKLWDVASRGTVATLTSGFPVYAVAFSPDGRILATGGNDTTVKLWNVASRQAVAALADHGNPINALAFSPDGHILVAGNADGTGSLWNPASHRAITPLAGKINTMVIGVAFSPDGRTLATGTNDGTAMLWDVKALSRAHP